MTLWLNCGRRRPWLPTFGINRDAMLHSCNTAGAGLLVPCKLRCKKAVEWSSRKAAAVSFVSRISGRMLGNIAGRGRQE
jgi:hypothetical protein